MKEILLQGRAVRKAFEGGLVLDQVDVDLFAGDFTVVMGPSGAGKSTLLYALSGMDRITGGEIIYKGRKSAVSPRIRWRACGAGNSVSYSSRPTWSAI